MKANELNQSPRRVCYFGTYHADYPRNRIMIEGLRVNGVEVIECHSPLWRGFEDRVQIAKGGWQKLGFWWRLLRAYSRLLWRYKDVGEYDALIVGYPGQLDVFLARLLSWVRRKPLVLDVCVPIYLIAFELGGARRTQIAVTLIQLLERTACHLCDFLIFDTGNCATWFQTRYGIPPDRFRLVPLGADERIFHPMTDGGADDGSFRVIYFGTFIPNHGVEFIIEAARIMMKDSTLHFELIGNGPYRQKAIELARNHGLFNITFTDRLGNAELVAKLGRADVCLGAFGITPPSLVSINNKVYEGLALAKPVITGHSPATREILEHGEHIYLCERADPESLANAIDALRQDPALRKRLARNGHQLFLRQFDIAQIGRRYSTHLEEIVSRSAYEL